MKGLNRDLAPISARVWERIDSEARDALTLYLGARRILDFEGPLGWEHSAVDLVRVEPLDGTGIPGAVLHKRVVRPLIELRVPFELELRELERVDRGAGRVDLDPLRDAARIFATAEDSALFGGYPEADIPGLLTDADHAGIPLPKDATFLPDTVSAALEELRRAGVGGPYILALGPEPYSALHRTTGEGGFPILRHVRDLIDRPVVWMPELHGGALLSMRGGDFKLVCGRDASIGYLCHDREKIQLYLEESFTAELNGPEAIVPLLPASELR